jgi:hypothetical protein
MKLKCRKEKVGDDMIYFCSLRHIYKVHTLYINIIYITFVYFWYSYT